MAQTTATPRWAIVEAPSVLGLKPTGVDGLAAALLGHGLADRLGARVAARLTPPPYEPARPQDTGTLNADGIARFSSALADAVGEVITAGDRPFVLGGDCSILLGSLLALRRRGRYGLLFVDGHADFYQPEANPNGEAASMDLAFATGRGPAVLANLEGRGPLVRDENVVAFAFRDEGEQRHGTAASPSRPGSTRSTWPLCGGWASRRRPPRRCAISRGAISTGSSSMSTRTCSTTRSCRRWTTVCPAGCRPWS